MKYLFGLLLLVFSFSSCAQCNIELGIPADFEMVEQTDSSMVFKSGQEEIFIMMKSEVAADYSFEEEAAGTLVELQKSDFYADPKLTKKELNGKEYNIIRTVVNDPELKDVNDYFNLGYLQVCNYVYSFTFMAANKNTVLHDATFERILSKTDYVD